MERLSALFDAASVGISVINTKGMLVRVNPKLCELAGLPEEKLIGTYTKDLAYSPEEDTTWSYYEQVLQGLTRVPVRVEKKCKKYNDGKDYWWADIWLSPVYDKDSDEVEYFVAILVDITDRKKAREDLRKSQEHYRSLFDNLSTAAAVYEAIDNGEDFIFVDFNKAGEKIEHISRENLIGKSVLKVFPGVKDFGLFDIFQRVYRTGQPEAMAATEYKYGKIKGTWRENLVYKQPTGEIVALYSDVTERRKAEDALVASEIRYRRLFEASKDGILILDAYTGEIVDVNPFLCKLLNYNREEIVCKKIWDLGMFGDRERSEKLFKELQDKEYIRYEDLDLQKKNGSAAEVEFVSNVYLVDHTKVIQCNIRDITARRKIETELEKSKKAISQLESAKQKDLLLSAQRLNAGIAHELRTPLQSILNCLELIQKEISDNQGLLPEKVLTPRVLSVKKNILELLEDGIDRTTYSVKVLNSLSEYSKIASSSELHLINVVPELKTIIRTLMFTDQFEDLEEDTFKVCGDEEGKCVVPMNRIDFSQLITNVCRNAKEAIVHDHPIIGIRVEYSYPCVKITITDNGKGIDPTLGEKIFEPYFSTKENPDQYNQGLGLAMVRDIIVAYGGSIDYTSRPGHTEFIIKLPCKQQG